MRLLSPFCVTTVITLACATQAFAQRAPAIPGLTGSIVTPETAKAEKKAEDKGGAAIKDAVTREDKGPLSDLTPGTTVVIRHGTAVTEGIVSKVDVGDNEITVRYDSKKIETLVLADKASADTRTVEYTSDVKRRVTRYFKLKS